MKYDWNWTDFFKQDVHLPFGVDLTIIDREHELLRLPFAQGLAVIVTSVPTFAHQQWVLFQTRLAQYPHPHIDYWLLVGQLMREYLDEVRHWLSYDVEHATRTAQQVLTERDEIEQFALIACLHHYAQSSMQARMMLQYLLDNHDAAARQMQNLLLFYQNLTDRQKDVAALAAHGLTNQEIADILYIEPAVVAEHLTTIFSRFQDVIPNCPDKHGTRYRLIHWLTRLFSEHPYLLFDRPG